MSSDEYKTISTGRPPPKRPATDYQPTAREHFWLLVGCVGLTGVAIGISVQTVATRIAMVLGG